ncbi:MAG: PspC domain-containing protein [Acidimicrobiales bacterium]
METTKTSANDTTTSTSAAPAPVRRLERTEGKFGGVAAGLGEHFDPDPTMIRLGLVAVTLLGGFPVVPVAYLAAWAIIPKQPSVALLPPRYADLVTIDDSVGAPFGEEPTSSGGSTDASDTTAP